MYQDVLEIDLRNVKWDEKLWKEFFKRIRRKHRKIEAVDIGILRYYYKNARITEFEIQAFVSGFLSEFLDEREPIILPKIEIQEKKILPLNQKPESSTYLFYSTRLAIVQAYPEYAQWLMQYFVCLRLYYNEDNMNYLFFEEDLEDVLDMNRLVYKEIQSNIITYIKKNLEEGSYVNIHLDEYYISEKDYFQRRHYVHESLIYGYNDEEKVFYAFGFGKNQKVECFQISYEECLVAYEKGKLFFFCGAAYLEKDYPWPVTLCSLREKKESEFTVSVFIDKLKKYLYPPQKEMVEEDIHVYGTDIYQWIILELREGERRGFVDFRIFQLLYEQKCCIRRRLEYLQGKYNLEMELKEFWEEYKKVEGSFQRIRLIYLKQLCMEGKKGTLGKAIRSESVNYSLANKLEMAVQEERKVLEKLIQVLEELFFL